MKRWGIIIALILLLFSVSEEGIIDTLVGGIILLMPIAVIYIMIFG